MMQSRPVTIVITVALAISWGSIALIVREDIPWQSLVTARVWLGAITMIGVMAIAGQLRMPSTHRRHIVIAGVLLAVHWAAFFLALKLTTVAVVLAIGYLGPVAASALAPRLLNETVHARVYVALGVAFTGVILVVTHQGSGSEVVPNHLGGMGAALVAGSTFAALMLVSKSAVDAVGPLAVTTGELVVASIVMAPWLGGALSGLRSEPIPMLTLGVVLTGLAFPVYWAAMRRLSVVEVSVLMHVEPASAAVFAMLFLGETPVVWQWIGIGMVIAGGLMTATNDPVEEVEREPAHL